ncbi:TPA: hypothetical protein EYP37_07820 [Candidatus Poribacteria bacterium]|nr:hypothetical protein [Candidatus Poribacteria bacterium]
MKIRLGMKVIKVNRLGWVIIVLTLLHVLPIWSFRYFPSQDGPCHLENSYMLLHYFDKDKTYSRYYELNLKPFPNWFSHLTLAFMMLLLPPIISEKILLTAYVILFVLSILYFLRSVDEEKLLLSLFAFPFIYNYLLHMGFYNFSFSFPLTFLTIGYWWRRRERWNEWRVMVGLNLLLIFLYFCHILSQLLAVGSILLLAALYNRVRVQRTAVLAVSLLPSYLLPIYFVRTYTLRHGGRWAMGDLLSYFSKIGSLTSFDLRGYHLGRAVAILFALLLLYTLFWEKLRLKGGRFRFDMKDCFFLLAVIFFGLYLYMPDGISGGGFVTTRLNLYPFIVILPWLSVRFVRPVKYVIGGVLILVSLVHLGFTSYYYFVLNRGLEEYTSGIPYVGANETILPLSFDHYGRSARIGLYLHAAGYYCAEKGAIELDNYEGATGYFPLSYRSSMNPFKLIGNIEGDPGNVHPEKYPEPIDYILLWSPKDQFPALKWIERNYRLIHSRGRLRLYRRISPRVSSQPLTVTP